MSATSTGNLETSHRAGGGSLQWFTEHSQELGLNFTHFNGMSGQFYISEMIGSGCALVDYDNDGELDVFLLQGQGLGERPLPEERRPSGNQLPLQSRLYRSDLSTRSGSTPGISFTDVTLDSRIDVRGYAIGVATGDFDRNGCLDLYVTSFGTNQLLRNNCDGTFTEVSRQAHVDLSGWSVSASFLDYDRDGWLDLFVGNYIDYSLESPPQCYTSGGERDYCGPKGFRSQPARLYKNQRDGTFADVSREALVGGHHGPALGVTAADFDNDGWVDIYVANDGERNLLWMNQHDGSFSEVALLAGAALSAEGRPEGSMGVDAGDFDNDGDEDLYMTHLPAEGNNLYINDGQATFEDRSVRSRLGPFSLGDTGFGTAWIDYDNDGLLDLLAINGAISLKTVRSLEHAPYEELNALFRNMGDGRFEDVTSEAGPAFRVPGVGRGACFGDMDNDGDTDVVVMNNSGPTRVLLNNIGNQAHWLGLRLVGASQPSSDMLGSRVVVTRPDGRTIWRRAKTDGSYASAHDPRVLVGLGESAGPFRVRVIWPDGRSEEWADVPADRYTTLTQGTSQ
jgi:hypothetical protein